MSNIKCNKCGKEGHEEEYKCETMKKIKIDNNKEYKSAYEFYVDTIPEICGKEVDKKHPHAKLAVYCINIPLVECIICLSYNNHTTEEHRCSYCNQTCDHEPIYRCRWCSYYSHTKGIKCPNHRFAKMEIIECDNNLATYCPSCKEYITAENRLSEIRKGHNFIYKIGLGINISYLEMSEMIEDTIEDLPYEIIDLIMSYY